MSSPARITIEPAAEVPAQPRRRRYSIAEKRRIFEESFEPKTPVARVARAHGVVAVAIRYALERWSALLRYCEDGRIEMDNNAAERALRAVALGRKNYLFAGSDAGGERAAAV